MPMIPVMVHVAICDVCGSQTTHGSSPESPLARESLERAGWLFLPTGGLKNTSGASIDTFCPRCAPLIKLQLADGSLELTGT